MGSSSREVIDLISSSSEDENEYVYEEFDFEILDEESEDDEVQFVRVSSNATGAVDALVSLGNGGTRREEERASSAKRPLPPPGPPQGGGKKPAIHYLARGWTVLPNQGLEFVLLSREHELDEAVTSLAKAKQDKPFSLKVGREFGVLKVLLLVDEGRCESLGLEQRCPTVLCPNLKNKNKKHEDCLS